MGVLVFDSKRKTHIEKRGTSYNDLREVLKKIPTIKEKIIRIVEEYGELSLMNNKLELKGFNILSKSITYALKVLK